MKRASDAAKAMSGTADLTQVDQSHRHLYLLTRDLMRENRRYRRGRGWKKFLFLLLGLLVVGIALFGDKIANLGAEHIAKIDIKETISSQTTASADKLIPALQRAFKSERVKAIVLDINSPGGSAVHSDRVFAEIMRLRKEHPETKVYAVCNDVCASGAYYIAASADEIYANKASIVGSIGVITAIFGFDKVLDNLAIENRTQTAGNNKGMLDIFSPENPEQREMMQVMLDEIHEQFIAAVKEGRGDKLSDNPDIFSGRFWNGQEGQRLGLVDKFGAIETIKLELDMPVVDYSIGTSPIAQALGVSARQIKSAVLSSDAPAGAAAVVPGL